MDLVLRDIPDRLGDALRDLAGCHNTTVEAEAVSLLTANVAPEPRKPKSTPAEILARIEAAGIRTPSNSVEIIRQLRDGG